MSFSVGKMLDDAKGRPSGFDYLRIILSFSVILFHSIQYSYVDGSEVAWNSWARGLFKFIVPMFFCLSGFLVAGSAVRSKTIVKFVGLRVIRIYPALVAEVFISALVIGPSLTEFPLKEYFYNQTFFRYLGNVSGDISFALPGLFQHNPYPNIVNSQLWTIRYELYCYMAMALILCFKKKSIIYVIPAAIFLLSLYIIFQDYHDNRLFKLGQVEDGKYLTLDFLAGVLAFLLRDKIPYSRRILMVAFVFGFVLTAYVPSGDLLAVYPIIYMTIFIGVSNPRKIVIVQFADLSYGVYLYGAVIQQALIQIFPWSHHWYVNFLLTIIPVICVGWLSWNFVEKPAAKLRKYLEFTEAKYLIFKQRFVLSQYVTRADR